MSGTKYLNILKRRLNSSSSRSKTIAVNSIILLLCKGLTMLISIVLLPLTVGYVSSEKYGVWVSISSIASWLAIFDLGMGLGLKNRYVECVASNNREKAQQYVSTTYAMLSLIFIPLLAVFLVLNPFIDWRAVLNVNIDENLNRIFAILITYVCMNFIFSSINTVLMAEQKPGEASIRQLVQQIFILVTIFVLTRYTDGSLLYLCLALCVVPLSILVIFNITLFSNRYKDVRPTFKKINFSLLKDLFQLSLKFFFLQSVALILFQLTNFIIIRYYSAEDVTLYNVAYKYFSVPTTFFAAIITPIWAAVTDAINKDDYKWIQNTLKRYGLILLSFIGLEIIMLVICKPIYHLWMGNTISDIPFIISMLCMFGAVATMIPALFVNTLCGAGYLKLQMIFCVVSPIVFLSLCFLFIKILHLGVYSVLLSSLLSNIYGVVVAPIQCYKVFYKKEKGLWIE